MFKIFKSASTDYEESFLPHNRKEAFMDIMKQRYKLLMLLGIILFCFSIPVLIAIFFQSRINYNIALNISLGTMAYQAAIEELIPYKFITNFILFLGLFIFLVGVAGCSKVFLKLTYLEGIIFGYDFKEGIKQNYKDLIIAASIMFFIYIVFDYVSSLILLNDIELLSFMIALPYAVLILLIIPCFMIYINLTCIYSDNISQKIKNSFYIYTKYFPIVLLFVSMLLIHNVVFVQPNFIISFVVIFIYFLFILPLVLLGWFLFSNKMLDECINSKFYPHIVGKGLEK